MTAATELVTAAPGPGLRVRARRGRFGIVVGLLLVLVLVVLLIGTRGGDFVPLSTENSQQTGTRALAQILRQHGVEVRQVDRLAEARVGDPASTTIAIASPDLLSSAQLESLATYPGDIVLLGTSPAAFDALGLPLTDEPVLFPADVEAGCEDPDAVAAGRMRMSGAGVVATDDIETCFTSGTASGYASAERGGRIVSVIASTDAVTNGALADLGHAALAVRALGRHADVVWYVADGFDSSLLTWSGADDAGSPPDFEAAPDFLPPGTGSAFYALALAVLVAAVWKARRFGALVAEPLPVVVRASEATRGRARLYRRARATGRAAASLRAAAAMRMGRRIGVARADGRDALVAAVARASDRTAQDVERILYGPPPANDAALQSLISELDALESEVHRP